MSEKVRKRFDRALKRSEYRKRREERQITIPRPLKNIAVVVLVIGTLLFTGMIAIQPVRATMMDVIVKWYDKYIGILFTTEDEVPTEINEIILPKHLPDDWEVTQLSANSISAEHIIKTKEGDRFRLTQVVLREGEQWLDNEDVSIKKVDITNEIEGTFYLYPDRVTLVWQEQYVFILRGGAASSDLLLKIAKLIISE